MNPPSAELLLAIALVALYVQDSASLLHFDDVLVAGTRRGWHVSTGSDLELRGRFLFVPNVLLPAGTLFRSNWLQPAAGPDEDPDALASFAKRLWPIRIGCMFAGAAILVMLPALLLTSRDPLWMLGAVCLAYLWIIAMLTMLFVQRKALGLTGFKFAALVTESILCPPHAVNLYRRMCALRGFRGDPIRFASRTLSTHEREHLRSAINARIALFALADDGNTPRAAALHAAAERIARTLA